MADAPSPGTPQPSQPGTTTPSPSTSTSSVPLIRPRMPPRARTTAGTNAPERTRKALEGIRAFIGSKSCYDILPESFRLIVFDNKLGITKSLQALVTNGVVSAPLYNSTTHRFAGMFTLADVVHLIQYYYLTAQEYGDVVEDVESFRLEGLRKIEEKIDVPPPPTVSVHPDQPLSDACAALVRTHARRLPLVDRDDMTGKETIVSVLTQYRVLKFIAINCAHDCARLDQSIGSLGIGSYCAWYEPPPDPHPLASHPPSAAASANPSAATSPTDAPVDAAGLDKATLEAVTEASLPPSVVEEKEKTEPAREAQEEKAMNEHGGDDTPRTGEAASASAHPDGLAAPMPSTASAASTSVAGQAAAQASNLAAADFADPSVSSAAGHGHDDDAAAGAGDGTHAMGVSDRFWPLSTATMETSVFDVVHIFSERGISAVPIVDEDGVVLNLYETVDIVDLVRQNAYQVLDSTISDAIAQRSPDFTGVMTCTPQDTLSSILAFVRERRVHRFVIVEPEDVPSVDGRPPRKKGSLVGVLSLSDVLRFLVGHENLKGMEVPGLGVHGLRGVHTHGPLPSRHASRSSAPGAQSGTETDADAASLLGGLTDDGASSIGGGSKTTSRRGSETTSERDLGVGELATRMAGQGLGLSDVTEGEAVQ
ncbi:hypothetical protein JCM8097_001502 [Rhodosporidiobolus ruineniae]